MKRPIETVQYRLSRDDRKQEYRACVAFSFFAVVTVYGLLSL